MEQSGEYRIGAHREVVWRALHDPKVLARCIDGCQSFEAHGEGRYEAVVRAQVGPVHATFDTELSVFEPVPPSACSIAAQIKGGMAGFGRGMAHVSLAEEATHTSLLYRIEGGVGGKLAEVSEKLIDAAARKMADDFFTALNALVGPRPGETPPAAVTAPRLRFGGEWLTWAVAGAAVLAAAACLWLLRR